MAPPAGEDVLARLPAQRRAIGVTQAQLGELLDVSGNTIARWERGELAVEHAGMLRAAVEDLVAIAHGDQRALEAADARQRPEDVALITLIDHGTGQDWFLPEVVAAALGIAPAETRKKAAALNCPVMMLHRPHRGARALAHVPHSFARSFGLPTGLAALSAAAASTGAALRA